MEQHDITAESEPDLRARLSTLSAEVTRRDDAKCRQGLIISGPSVALLASYDDLREQFLGMADRVEVVLACRVSPK